MKHIPPPKHIQNYVTSLQKKQEKPAPAQSLLCGCLQDMLPQWDIYTRIISADSPFLKEFSDSVKAGDTSPETCFALLECCILFIREKALTDGLPPLSAVEQSLLHHFETSGMWSLKDGLLVSWWYWYELPRRCKGAEGGRS